jgi:hypothetical protein
VEKQGERRAEHVQDAGDVGAAESGRCGELEDEQPPDEGRGKRKTTSASTHRPGKLVPHPRQRAAQERQRNAQGAQLRGVRFSRRFKGTHRYDARNWLQLSVAGTTHT